MPLSPPLLADHATADSVASDSATRGGASSSKSQPLLAGIRVLDLTNVLSGPFCAYQLAQLGAEVIKVEMPRTGDLARQLGADDELNRSLMGASFLAQNAGKKSITIDLKNVQGTAVLQRLARTADVLVENFRPGVMQRLGVGHETLLATNPALIYCAISGFGQDGPLKDAPAYDQIIQGMSGMMSITGDERCAPLRVGFPVADTFGGITAAFAISAALVRRAKTGQGAFIDVSMLDSALTAMGWVVSNFLIGGQEPAPMGNDNFTAAPSGTFATGKGLINIAANKQEQFDALCRLLGRETLVDDPRFATRGARKQHRQALTMLLEEALSTKPAVEWEALLNANGIPAGRVLSVPEALRAPQVAHRQLIKTFGADGERRVSVTRAGFKVGGADPDVSCAPPRLGQDTTAVLTDLGYSPEEIERLRDCGAV